MLLPLCYKMQNIVTTYKMSFRNLKIYHPTQSDFDNKRDHNQI